MKIRKSKKTATSTRLINVQRRKNSCGPTAFANALKWLGYPVNHDEMVDFCKAHDLYDHEVGMYVTSMKRLVKILTIKCEFKTGFKTKDLDRAIDSGRSVILLYRVNGEYFHAVFIDDRTRKAYRAWNMAPRKKGPWHDRKKVTKSIASSLRGKSTCRAFVITPEE